MKKEHIILLIAGAILVVLLYKSKKGIVSPSVIKPGDKGNEVYGLQYVLSSVTGLQFKNMGAYDTDTLNAVRYYLKDSNALLDYDKGYVSKDFASDLYLVQDKIIKE